MGSRRRVDASRSYLNARVRLHLTATGRTGRKQTRAGSSTAQKAGIREGLTRRQ